MAMLRGDLSVLGFSNLLQVLVQSGCEGLLTLDFGAYRKVLRLDRAGFRLLRGSKRSNSLDRLLDRVRPLAAAPPAPGQPPGGHPDRPTIERVIREWLLEELCEVFRWSRGTFTFEPSEAAEKGKDQAEGLWSRFPVQLDVMTIVLEAARRGDELARFRAQLPEVSDVPERTPAFWDRARQEMESDVLGDVVPLIDGRRSLGLILRISIFPRFSVLEAIYGLLQRGLIRFRMAGGPPLEAPAETERSESEMGDVLAAG